MSSPSTTRPRPQHPFSLPTSNLSVNLIDSDFSCILNLTSARLPTVAGWARPHCFLPGLLPRPISDRCPCRYPSPASVTLKHKVRSSLSSAQICLISLESVKVLTKADRSLHDLSSSSLPSSLSDFHLSPPSLSYLHTDLFVNPSRLQVAVRLRMFALAVPSIWNAISPAIHVVCSFHFLLKCHLISGTFLSPPPPRLK